MATTIDATWKANNGYGGTTGGGGNGASGPFPLTLTGETYELGEAVSVKETAFVVEAANITLDLKGFDVTYGDSTLINATNWDFSSALGAEWTLSGTVTRATIDDEMALWGGTHMVSISSGGFIESASITIPSGDDINGRNREYQAVAFVWDSSKTDGVATIDVINNSTGASIASEASSSGGASAGRGRCVRATFNSGQASAVRIRVTASNQTIKCPFATVRHAEDFGIYCTASGGGGPLQLNNIPQFSFNNSCADFTLKNTGSAASVKTGTSLGADMIALGCNGNNGVTVDGTNLTLKASGIIDGKALSCRNSSSVFSGALTVTGGTLETDVTVTRDRFKVNAAVDLTSWSNGATIKNSTLTNPYQAAFRLLSNQGSAILIENVTIVARGTSANSYLFTIVGSKNITIRDCTATTVAGYMAKGFIIDSWSQNTNDDIIFQNDSLTCTQSIDTDGGVTSGDTAGGRVRNSDGVKNGTTTITIQDCTFDVRSGGTLGGVPEKNDCIALALDQTIDPRATSYVIRRNTLKAIAFDTSANAWALHYANNPDPRLWVLTDNTLRSNHLCWGISEFNKTTSQEILGTTFEDVAEGAAKTFAPIGVTSQSNAQNCEAYGNKYIGGAAGGSSAISWESVGPNNLPNKITLGAYAQVKVTKGAAVISGAFVTVRNNVGNVVATGTTDSDGLTPFLRIPTFQSVYNSSTSIVETNWNPNSIESVDVVEGTKAISITVTESNSVIEINYSPSANIQQGVKITPDGGSGFGSIALIAQGVKIKSTVLKTIAQGFVLTESTSARIKTIPQGVKIKSTATATIAQGVSIGMSLVEFNPTIKPSYGSSLDVTYRPDATRFHKGYDQVKPQLQRGLMPANLTWYAVDEDQKDYIESFISQFAGSLGPFAWRPFDNVPSPLGIKPEVTEVAGGALAGRTYSVGFTWWDAADGETKMSAVSSITIAVNKLLKVSVPPIPHPVEGFRVYANTTAGSETLQASISAVRTWTEPTGGLVAGAVDPVSNTLNPKIKFMFTGQLAKTRIGPSTWELSIEILEQLV